MMTLTRWFTFVCSLLLCIMSEDGPYAAAAPTSTVRQQRGREPADPDHLLPNVIILQPDDLAFYGDEAPALPPSTVSLSLAAGGKGPTPHMDRLKTEGITFTRA
jgi:hypothetical protein